MAAAVDAIIIHHAGDMEDDGEESSSTFVVEPVMASGTFNLYERTAGSSMVAETVPVSQQTQQQQERSTTPTKSFFKRYYTRPLSPKSPSAQRPVSTKRSRFLLPRLGSKEKIPTETAPVLDEENKAALGALMRVVEDRIKRNELVQSLLKEKCNSAVKVRFIAAAREYEEEKDKLTKKSKGRKIIAMFVQNGSMFQLQNIPYQLEQALLGQKLEAITDLKKVITTELIKNEDTRAALRQLGEDF